MKFIAKLLLKFFPNHPIQASSPYFILWLLCNFLFLFKLWKLFIFIWIAFQCHLIIKIICIDHITLHVQTWKITHLIYLFSLNNIIMIIESKKNYKTILYALLTRFLFAIFFGIAYKYFLWIITFFNDFSSLASECENKIWWLQLSRIKWAFVSSLKREFIQQSPLIPRKKFRLVGKDKVFLIILYRKW